MSKIQLSIGARGWQHTAWVGDFYPDDLPEDWQLGYYSNEFRIVLVPADTDLADATAWLEDSAESLQFVFEIDLEQHTEAQARFELIEQFAQQAGSRCAGVLACCRSRSLESEWIERLCEWQQRLPVCLDVTDAKSLDEELSQRLGVCGIGRSWREAGEFPAMGQLIVAMLHEPQPSPAILRGCIEKCLKASGHRQCTIFLCADPPSIEAIRNANIIMDLL